MFFLEFLITLFLKKILNVHYIYVESRNTDQKVPPPPLTLLRHIHFKGSI